MMDIQQVIASEAERLGFLLHGVTPAARPAHYATYADWVANGRHAGMAYLAAERAMQRRVDPRQILEKARSLLVVGLRYPAPFTAQPGPAGEALGRVAAYAWGADYHDVIVPLLEELIGALEKHLGRPVTRRAYTDTGAILERDFAQAAGLGWAGKNTCLISPRQGSYFLLGESLLDVEIEPSEPITTDHCGTCTRCIQACPTGCILPDRTIDAGRCISYLTIENKGPIPPDLRPRVGDWVFGCDICQEVCPWNVRFAAPESHPALRPRPGTARPALREALRLGDVEFRQKFQGSPILRAKRRGYLRNVAVALGNQRDPAAVPELAQALRADPEPLVRGHAAWALGRMPGKPARRTLEQARRQEPNPAVRAEVDQALDQG